MDVHNLLKVYNAMDQENKDNFIRQLNLSSEEEFLKLVSTIPKFLEDFTVYDIHRNLQLYVPPFLLVIGILGNLLAFVMFRTHSKNVSTYALLSALAVTDFCVLNVGLLRLWVEQLTSIDVADQANWICKLVVFLGYVSSDSSVWLIVAVTVERYIAVCNPLHAQRTCSIRRAKFVIATPILSLAIINAHVLFTVELVKTNSSELPAYICEAGVKYQVLVQDVWPWVDAVLYSFLPFLILIVLNGNIIHKVFAARVQRECLLRTGMSSTGCHKSRAHSSRKLTLMLLLVSFTFVLTTLPMNVVMIYTAFWNDSKEHSAQQIANFKLAKTISELLMYVNHSVNFYLYCITGRKFRMQIYNILCTCCRSKSNNKRYKLTGSDSMALPMCKYNTRVTYRDVPNEKGTLVFDSM